ncbi:hypothetical protein CAOG_09172 [Capsaspora owczarzaki ATCC 30864]|uniref:Uncharacterized protein n=1 Tax=Capsaspora owczarzaki (strain ATCC 30864) TaxID=595528 RepID=A0A0D2X5P6_CAPO3|nr:hypothetical protein CAOG_09172 [Capsaspora owczarzaki ATCC 30864]KJE98174.1 hypothetical protein CAOG_009172 [Capsaspora owczarzaki ATCC 30864]|eukprot:XP_011270885.1 hypothetical protein CAOG_09172 [Capsaspora owczarzaki ATCC 30864]
MSDVVESWTEDAVIHWLSGLSPDIARYAGAFRLNNITGKRLVSLTSEKLAKMGVASLGHQDDILEGIQALIAQPKAGLVMETVPLRTADQLTSEQQLDHAVEQFSDNIAVLIRVVKANPGIDVEIINYAAMTLSPCGELIKLMANHSNQTPYWINQRQLLTQSCALLGGKAQDIRTNGLSDERQSEMATAIPALVKRFRDCSELLRSELHVVQIAVAGSPEPQRPVSPPMTPYVEVPDSIPSRPVTPTYIPLPTPSSKRTSMARDSNDRAMTNYEEVTKELALRKHADPERMEQSKAGLATLDAQVGAQSLTRLLIAVERHLNVARQLLEDILPSMSQLTSSLESALFSVCDDVPFEVLPTSNIYEVKVQLAELFGLSSWQLIELTRIGRPLRNPSTVADCQLTDDAVVFVLDHEMPSSQQAPQPKAPNAIPSSASVASMRSLGQAASTLAASPDVPASPTPDPQAVAHEKAARLQTQMEELQAAIAAAEKEKQFSLDALNKLAGERKKDKVAIAAAKADFRDKSDRLDFVQRELVKLRAEGEDVVNNDLKGWFNRCKKKGSSESSWKRNFLVFTNEVHMWNGNEAIRDVSLNFYTMDITKTAFPKLKFRLDLTGSRTDIAYTYKKRQNVFLVQTADGKEYLLQAEDQLTMHLWVKSIQAACGLGDEAIKSSMLATTRKTVGKKEAKKMANALKSLSTPPSSAPPTPTLSAPTSASASALGSVAPVVLAHAQAMMNYEPVNAGAFDLKFNAGDIVLVTHRGADGWWEGMCRGKSGRFHESFVKEIDRQAASKLVAQEKQAMSTLKKKTNRGSVAFSTLYQAS